MRESDVYELLVRDVLESFGKLDGVRNFNVQRDVDLDGLSRNEDEARVKHQIDVYVTFELFGMRHEIVVQAKNWKNPVDMPTLMAFQGVLSDLPGHPRGIMVTKSGFDDGNIFGVAKTHNIGLYVLDEIKPGDFAPSIELTGEMTIDGVNIHEFFFDQPYDEELAKKIIDVEKDATEIILYDQDGRDVGCLDTALTVLAVQSKKQNKNDGDEVALWFTIEGKPLFIHTGDLAMARIRLAGFKGRYFKKLLASDRTETKLTHTLQLLTNRSMYYVDSQHKVHRSSFDSELELKGEYQGQEIRAVFGLGVQLPDFKGESQAN